MFLKLYVPESIFFRSFTFPDQGLGFGVKVSAGISGLNKTL